jgi:serine/threonine protein kinase
MADDDKVMELVEATLALPSDQRAEYLRRITGDDTTLYAEVWDMASLEERMGGFLKDPTLLVFPRDLPYRAVRRLGSGGMAHVFEAVDPASGGRVAVKVVRHGGDADPEIRRRFHREASLTRRLSHPNIVRVIDVVDSEQGMAIVMDLVEGLPLGALIAAGPMPVDQAVQVAVGVAEALAAAHGMGIVHRDLKPGNVMVEPGGG